MGFKEVENSRLSNTTCNPRLFLQNLHFQYGMQDVKIALGDFPWQIIFQRESEVAYILLC